MKHAWRALAAALCFAAPLAWAGTASNQANTLDVTALATTSPVVSFAQTTTTSAVALPNNTLTNGLICTAGKSNSGTVYVGGAGVTSSNGYPLAGGQSISFGVANSNQVYIVGSDSSETIVCVGN
jgi:hypothetical protein